MNEITIPSSPSWYLSNILVCNDDGTKVAYGAKHELVVLKVDNSLKPCSVTPTFIPFAHKDKVNALAFAPSPSNNFENHLVSCSDDGTVKVWDLETLSLVYSHSGHPVSSLTKFEFLIVSFENQFWTTFVYRKITNCHALTGQGQTLI